MKNVIVYYSFTHNNEKLARLLSEKLQCEKIRIETAKARSGFSIFLDIFLGRTPAVKPCPKSLAAYDHVTFVAPIWAAKIASPLKSFLRREQERINQYSFISLCGGAPGQKNKIERELVSLLGKKPQAHIELSIRAAMALHEDGKTRSAVTEYRLTAGELDIYESQLRQFILEHASVEADEGA